jgi:hypothetical protein
MSAELRGRTVPPCGISGSGHFWCKWPRWQCSGLMARGTCVAGPWYLPPKPAVLLVSGHPLGAPWLLVFIPLLPLSWLTVFASQFLLLISCGLEKLVNRLVLIITRAERQWWQYCDIAATFLLGPLQGAEGYSHPRGGTQWADSCWVDLPHPGALLPSIPAQQPLVALVTTNKRKWR